MARRGPPTNRMRDPSERALEIVLQELKVIDIKRRSIQSGKRREPFLFMLLAIAAIPVGIAAISVSMLGLFISGGILAAVSSQIYGPTGTRGRRGAAQAAIDKSINKIAEALPTLDGKFALRIFGLISAKPGNLILTDEAYDLDRSALEAVDANGAFFEAKYTYLVAIPYTISGGYDHTQPVLRGQYWLTHLKRKKVPAEEIEQVFARHAPRLGFAA